MSHTVWFMCDSLWRYRDCRSIHQNPGSFFNFHYFPHWPLMLTVTWPRDPTISCSVSLVWSWTGLEPTHCTWAQLSVRSLTTSPRSTRAWPHSPSVAWMTRPYPTRAILCKQQHNLYLLNRYFNVYFSFSFPNYWVMPLEWMVIGAELHLEILTDHEMESEIKITTDLVPILRSML